MATYRPGDRVRINERVTGDFCKPGVTGTVVDPDYVSPTTGRGFIRVELDPGYTTRFGHKVAGFRKSSIDVIAF